MFKSKEHFAARWIWILMTVLLVAAVAWTLFAGNDNKIMAVTGATPKALAEQAPSGIRLLVNGQVKQDYLFSGDTLNALAFHF